MKKFTYSLLGASCLAASCFSWGSSSPLQGPAEVSLSTSNLLQVKLSKPLYAVTGVKSEPAGTVALNYVSKGGKQVALTAQIDNGWLVLPAALPAYQQGDQFVVGSEKINVGKLYQQLNKNLGLLEASGGKVTMAPAHDTCDARETLSQSELNIYYLYNDGGPANDRKKEGASLRLKVGYQAAASDAGKQLAKKAPQLFKNVEKAVDDSDTVTFTDIQGHAFSDDVSFTQSKAGLSQKFSAYDHSQDGSVNCQSVTPVGDVDYYYDMQLSRKVASGTQEDVCAKVSGAQTCANSPSAKGSVIVQAKDSSPDTKNYALNCDYPGLSVDDIYPYTSNLNAVVHCWIGEEADSSDTTYDGKVHYVSPKNDVTGFPKSISLTMSNSDVSGSHDSDYASDFNYSSPGDVFKGYLKPDDMWSYVAKMSGGYVRTSLVTPYTIEGIKENMIDSSYSTYQRGYSGKLGAPGYLSFNIDESGHVDLYEVQGTYPYDFDMNDVNISVPVNISDASKNDLILLAASMVSHVTLHDFDDLSWGVPRGKLTANIKMYDQWGRVYSHTATIFARSAGGSSK